MTEDKENCDWEDNCKNKNAIRCAWCLRNYDNEFEETDYYEPKTNANDSTERK